MAATRRILGLAGVLAILLALATSGASAQQTRPNGAGLVVRHGDGTLIYAYVEFEGETISGEELLLRSGIAHVVSPFPGIGTGICMIDGEGCGADNCYCESYSTPAYFWHYYSKTADGWFTEVRGPSARQLSDGDIDGWSWTAGDHGLPAITIDELAAITGFDRSPPPTATPEPPPPTPTPLPESTATATPEPQPTATPTATPPPATSTSTPAQPTADPTSGATTATQAPSPTATAQPTPSTTPTPTPNAPTPTTDPRQPTPANPSPLTASPSPAPDSAAVILRPGATPEPLETSAGDGGGPGTELLLFSSFAVALAGAGVVLMLRRRQGEAS